MQNLIISNSTLGNRGREALRNNKYIMHALTVHLLSISVPHPHGLSRGGVPEVTLTGDAGSEQQNSFGKWEE